MCRYPSPDKTSHTRPSQQWRGFLLAGIRILAINSFYVPFVKFINFFAGALVATTAANVLLASDAYADNLPNGWTQVGKSCPNTDSDEIVPNGGVNTVHYKLRKDSNHSMYGVYKEANAGNEWDEKDITLAEANAKMNSKTGGCSGY